MQLITDEALQALCLILFQRRPVGKLSRETINMSPFSNALESDDNQICTGLELLRLE